MMIRLILQGLAFLFFFSSCSKEIFLFTPNTGGYTNVHKLEQTAATSYINNYNENSEEIVLAATNKENIPAINHTTANSLERALASARISTNYSKGNISLTLNGQTLNETENKPLKNFLNSSVSEKASSEIKQKSQERSGFIFSILSFASGLAGVFLTIFFSHFIFTLLGILAVICGLISLSKKEKLKGLAITGLILGLLGIFLLLVFLTFWDYGGH